MSQNPIDLAFQAQGRAASGDSDPGLDETLALYVDGRLEQHQIAALHREALRHPGTFELLRASVDALGVRQRPVALRILGRLVRDGVQRGLELVNAFELTLREPHGELVPALGRLRGEGAVDLLTIQGPGQGLDELELQVRPDGTTSLTVRADEIPGMQQDENASILFIADGKPREKRPFGKHSVTFAPLAESLYTIALTAKAPGAPSRTLIEAEVDLRG